MKKPIVPLSAPSQHHLLVADITDNLILTKEGGAALILQTSALNFSLLSEKEQGAMIFAYAALLNSLSFPIQILIRSQKKDVSRYLEFLEDQEENIKIEKLRGLMKTYRGFVASIVKKRNVLEKQFLIIIPFSPYELGISVKGLAGILSPQNGHKKLPYAKDYILKKAKTVLYPRRDHIIRQSGRLGIKVRQLENEELVGLFLETYKQGGEETQNGES